MTYLTPARCPSRREFLGTSLTCAAHVAFMASPFSASARRLWASRPQGRIVAEEPFGRIEEVGDGLYALISTPLGGDYTTVANGGIIAGRSGVVVVEGLMTADGAEWLARQARELTGRLPTHVVVTHYHGDHSRGVSGYFSESTTGPDILATETSRDLVLTQPAQGEETEETRLDRAVRIVPRAGHTPSDVTIELPEDGVVWCGDLVWIDMFPNYVDAVPSHLSTSVRAIQDPGWKTYVPGHGPLADAGAYARYLGVIDDVERAAREAIDRGLTAEQAGSRYELPGEFGEWALFNPRYYERAIGAWMRELSPESG